MWCCCHNRPPVVRDIKLVCVGVDGAGKTSILKLLQGESFLNVLTTNGFSNVDFMYAPEYRIVAYDLGGGERIRDIWENYYAEVHGVLFVVDLTDVNRLEETYNCIKKCITNRNTYGKPILFVLNNVTEGNVDDFEFTQQADLHHLCDLNKQHTFVTHCRRMETFKKPRPRETLKERTRDNPSPLLTVFCDFIDKVIEQYDAINDGVKQAELALKLRQQEARDARRLHHMQQENNHRKDDIRGLEMYSQNGTGPKPPSEPITVAELPAQDEEEQEQEQPCTSTSPPEVIEVKPRTARSQQATPTQPASKSSATEVASVLSSEVFEAPGETPGETPGEAAGETDVKSPTSNSRSQQSSRAPTSLHVQSRRDTDSHIFYAEQRFESRIDRIKRVMQARRQVELELNNM